MTDNVYFGDSKPKGDGEEAGEDDYGQYQSNGYGGYTGPDAGAVPAALLRISKYIAGKHRIRFAAMDGS